VVLGEEENDTIMSQSDAILFEMGSMLEDVSSSIPEGVYIKMYNSIMEIRGLFQAPNERADLLSARLVAEQERGASDMRRMLRDNITRLAEGRRMTSEARLLLAEERKKVVALRAELAAEKSESVWVVEPETLRVMTVAEQRSEENEAKVEEMEIECWTIRRAHKRLRSELEANEKVLNPFTGRMIAKHGETARKMRRLL